MKNFIQTLLLFITFFQLGNTYAQKVKKVGAKLTEPITENISIADFKESLKMKAQIKALADEFGTLIASNTDLTLDNSGTNLNTLSTSNVKGEWIKTTEINYKWFIEENDNGQKLYLSCEVKGKAREITKNKIDLHSNLLKCANKNLCITQKFKEGESLYLSIKSPIDGYISIFMREEEMVYRLLPYSRLTADQNNCIKVNADQEYVLFDAQGNKGLESIQNRNVDELQLSTMGKDKLYNRLYIVFSTTKFDKPMLNTENGIKTLYPEAFQDWITNTKLVDKNFQDQVIYFTVEQ
ncbi:DUF4384 domain-containing protein [Flammeovirga yaeyamensis]|uniref:DUF4384 domain-containing protein n=1 Tax=Flammeovirga yaeyamensis TaxID=367791 RepID=A0AAX1MYJ7_9BACT|nr:hypothetical protein [Flammeovirga yaeyamensis]MBB3696193.1 hypothetical protein [Flammeovirga yaeyamensis]NMF34876.1 DUF4384 domain-containing protein [Flammeovirga yaeyamensis]QWG00297.1 DUF4384 domain-containing protein [Flammeovirga yaeyamensis]